MQDHTRERAFRTGDVHDLLRGVAGYTGSGLVGDLADAIGRHPSAPFEVAFNPKQIASKRWLLDELHAAFGGAFAEVRIVGGWLGVLSGMILNDPRFTVGRVVSLDIDPSCAPVASALNRRFAAQGRFEAVTGDMHALDWPAAAAAGGLIINTSAEHIPDPGAWARGLPAGLRVVAQSNDYRAIPEHVSCVDSAEELAGRLGLSRVARLGALRQRRYTRFMVIGER